MKHTLLPIFLLLLALNSGCGQEHSKEIKDAVRKELKHYFMTDTVDDLALVKTERTSQKQLLRALLKYDTVIYKQEKEYVGYCDSEIKKLEDKLATDVGNLKTDQQLLHKPDLSFQKEGIYRDSTEIAKKQNDWSYMDSKKTLVRMTLMTDSLTKLLPTADSTAHIYYKATMRYGVKKFKIFTVDYYLDTAFRVICSELIGTERIEQKKDN